MNPFINAEEYPYPSSRFEKIRSYFKLKKLVQAIPLGALVKANPRFIQRLEK